MGKKAREVGGAGTNQGSFHPWRLRGRSLSFISNELHSMINLLQAVHITVIRLINYFSLDGHTLKVPVFKV